MFIYLITFINFLRCVNPLSVIKQLPHKLSDVNCLRRFNQSSVIKLLELKLSDVNCLRCFNPSSVTEVLHLESSDVNCLRCFNPSSVIKLFQHKSSDVMYEYDELDEVFNYRGMIEEVLEFDRKILILNVVKGSPLHTNNATTHTKETKEV